MHTVTCPICGYKFETNRPNMKYCGTACRIKAAELRRDANREKYLQYQREYYRKRKKRDAESLKYDEYFPQAKKYPPAG